MSDPIASMTGFARLSGEAEWGSWAFEAKSVNGRGLDIRLNIPGGFDLLDQSMRKAAGARFTRGNLQVSLRLDLKESGASLSVDQAALAALVEGFALANDGARPDGAALATLMSVRGVIESGGAPLRDLAADESVIAELRAGGDALLDELKSARLSEGAALKTMLLKHLADMESVLASATAHADTQPGLVKARFEKQLSDLEADTHVERERLAAEVAITAAKADVCEELDRLHAHIASARDLIETGGALGRKLDFLAQEFNREANTLCSKSASLDLTNDGLALKGLIDQFKEQAANVE